MLNASMSVQLVENWLLTIPFYEIKSCGVVPSSYIKLKRRILQAWSFKYSIKKCIFPVVDEVILVASGSPLPSSFLRWACHFLTIDLFLFFSVLFCKLAVNTSNITRQLLCTVLSDFLVASNQFKCFCLNLCVILYLVFHMFLLAFYLFRIFLQRNDISRLEICQFSPI